MLQEIAMAEAPASEHSEGRPSEERRRGNGTVGGRNHRLADQRRESEKGARIIPKGALLKGWA